MSRMKKTAAKKPFEFPLSEQLRVIAKMQPEQGTLREIFMACVEALAKAEGVEGAVVEAALSWYRAQYENTNSLSRGYRSEGRLARACARLYKARGKEPLKHPPEKPWQPPPRGKPAS